MNPIKVASLKDHRDELKALCDLNIDAEEAEKLLCDVLEHQKKIEFFLGRSIDFVVVALDYLSLHESRSRELMIVEKKKYQEAWQSAYTDPLTGLHNRRYLTENLSREIEKSKRYHLNFSLIFFDLDHFKSVNDKFGHLVGDMVLQRAAKLIRKVFRTSDLVARFGGEEFVVLMPQTSAQMAWKVGERLRCQYQQQNREIVKGEYSGLTLCGGIVTCPGDSEEALEILKFADEALYVAKRKGRNRIYSYREVNTVRELHSQTVCTTGALKHRLLRKNDHRHKSVVFSNGVKTELHKIRMKKDMQRKMYEKVS